MLIFASDVDDTLIVSDEIVNAFFSYLTSRNIPNFQETYDRTHCWNQAIPNANPNQLYKEFYASGQAPLPRIMPGARDALEQIHDLYHIHLVTSRSQETIARITPHLDGNLFVDAKYQSIYPCGGKSKRPVLEQLAAVFYVDDSIKELQTLADIPNLQLIQFPYFSTEGSPVLKQSNVIRLKSCSRVGKDSPDQVRQAAWQEIAEIVLSVTSPA